MANWCVNCARYETDDEEFSDIDYCEILGDTFAFGIDHPKYPDEWIYDADGKPCCTAFLRDGEKPQERCTRTIDMFNNAEDK